MKQVQLFNVDKYTNWLTGEQGDTRINGYYDKPPAKKKIDLFSFDEAIEKMQAGTRVRNVNQLRYSFYFMLNGIIYNHLGREFTQHFYSYQNDKRFTNNWTTATKYQKSKEIEIN
jgi:hypothetical protein